MQTPYKNMLIGSEWLHSIGSPSKYMYRMRIVFVFFISIHFLGILHVCHGFVFFVAAFTAVAPRAPRATGARACCPIGADRFQVVVSRTPLLILSVSFSDAATFSGCGDFLPKVVFFSIGELNMSMELRP